MIGTKIFEELQVLEERIAYGSPLGGGQNKSALKASPSTGFLYAHF